MVKLSFCGVSVDSIGRVRVRVGVRVGVRVTAIPSLVGLCGLVVTYYVLRVRLLLHR